MNLTTVISLSTLVTAIGGGGFWFATELNTKADHSEVQVVSAKADYALDKQIEYILAQINKLVAKKNKTPDDFEQLRYLREELKRLREIRRGS